MIPIPIPIPAFPSDLIPNPNPIPKWLKISVIPESIPIPELESPIFATHGQKLRGRPAKTTG